MVFEGLKPVVVWQYFDEICKVPRPSKQEEQIIEYLKDFGKKHNLETLVDKVGNVLIRKPASKGYENRKGVVLQSHIDMVCEKNSDVQHDFLKDPIKPVVDGDWVRATGTTLGADDGIGVATQLAILSSDSIEHPALECLFTVDEETGMTGAFEIESGWMKYKTFINLDSEDEGELFIGCAGGVDTVAIFDNKWRKTPKNSVAFRIDIKGLRGGHSGDDIGKGYGNSNKMLNRVLWSAKEFKVCLNKFDGGNLRNAVPREAFAIVTVKQKVADKFKEYVENYGKILAQEYSITEPNFQLTINTTETPEMVIKKGVHKRLLNAIYACPNGVIAMSQSIEGLVETSTNLASVKFLNDAKIEVVTSQRSSVESARDDIANMVKSVFNLAGANAEHTDGYPGWNPNTNSEILSICEDSYERIFGKKPIVRAIHAGLECGLLLEKYPDMDMISFGPTLRNVHAPDEKINIPTVDMFWQHLLDVLKNIPENK